MIFTRLGDGILKFKMEGEFDIHLKLPMEVDGHKEDEDQFQFWKRWWTYLILTEAELWRRNCRIRFRSKCKRLMWVWNNNLTSFKNYATFLIYKSLQHQIFLQILNVIDLIISGMKRKQTYFVHWHVEFVPQMIEMLTPKKERWEKDNFVIISTAKTNVLQNL